MYLFEATYINVFDDTTRTKTIEFDGQFFDTVKESYMYAMSIAYDSMDKKTECFDKLDFIAN